LKPQEAHGSLRLTLGRYTTEVEIDKVLEVLPRAIKRLRKISPLSK
jgi:cysteine desulfurase